MLPVNVSLGEYADRLAILWVKVSKLDGHKRRVSLKRFAEMEKQLRIPEETKDQIDGLSQKLLKLHQELWEAEDAARDFLVRMPNPGSGSVDGWFDAAAADNVVRMTFMRYSQATVTLRLLNDERHNLVTQIDVLAGESTEPKSFVPDSNGRIAKDSLYGKQFARA
jgi:hypothetical protein